MLLASMFAILTIDDNVCTGLGCPLTLGLFVYLIIAVLGCCCCYPGACFCPQTHRRKDSTKSSFLARFNLLGSIADIMHAELDEGELVDDGMYQLPADDDGDDDFETKPSIRRRVIF